MGRGSSGGGGGGPSLGGGSGKSVNILNQTDVWSYRHRQDNAPFVDAINSGVATIQSDFPDVMETVNAVNAARLGGRDRNGTLGFYSSADKTVALNVNYTDIDKMNRVYDNAVKSGFHPARGNKSGTEAVALHEMGHALTDHVGRKMGAADLDDAAKRIVDSAYARSGGTGGTKAWASRISGYATKNNAECVAEAVADWYCNGNNAKSQSKAIMAELRRYR